MRDHPRACGEHACPMGRIELTKGSSPRLRGTRGLLPRVEAAGGIIPALAGNTLRGRTAATCRKDHPRACGEHTAPVVHVAASSGSSPRLRGTLIGELDAPAGEGIIPALAGNTWTPCACVSSSRDHPRACGEHARYAFAWRTTTGSSPRLRGTRHLEHDHDRVHGIIPALAGNTRRVFHAQGSWRDHPRACGEHHRRGTSNDG